MYDLLRKIKYFLLAIATFVTLLIFGTQTIQKQALIHDTESILVLTSFDYCITKPSVSQIEELKENKEAVAGVFPVIAYQTQMNGNAKATINLMLSDEMNSFDHGLLTKNTLIAGSYDENGLMLDKEAATLLNVNVGDTITYSVLGVEYQKTLSGIYITSNYINLKSGIAVAKFDEALSSKLTKDPRYNWAFITANDKEKCQALMDEYISLRDMYSKEQYLSLLYNQGTLEQYMNESDEAFEARCNSYYDSYVTQYKKDNKTNMVTKKETSLKEAKETVIYLNDEIAFEKVIINTSISIILVLIFFTFTILDGRRYLRYSRFGSTRESVVSKSKLSFGLITGAGFLVFLILLAEGIYYASSINMMSKYWYYAIIAISYAGPTLLLMPIAHFTSWLFTKKYYSTASYEKQAIIQKKNDKHLKDSSIPFQNAIFAVRDYIRGRFLTAIAIVVFTGTILGIILPTGIIGLSIKEVSIIERYANTTDDVVFTIATAPKDTFISYNSGATYLLTDDDKRLNTDIYSTIPEMKYRDNILKYTGGLRSGECIVSKNLLSQYGLSIGDELRVSGETLKLKIVDTFRPQAGIDNKYVHEGIVLFYYSDEVVQDIYGKKNISYMVSVDKDTQVYPTTDYTREKPIVYRVTEMEKALFKVIGYSIAIVLIIMLASIFAEILASRSYKRLGRLYSYGLSKNKVKHRVILIHIIMLYIPLLILIGISLRKYNQYTISAVAPMIAIFSVAAVVFGLFTSIEYRRIVQWKTQQKHKKKLK